MVKIIISRQYREIYAFTICKGGPDPDELFDVMEVYAKANRLMTIEIVQKTPWESYQNQDGVYILPSSSGETYLLPRMENNYNPAQNENENGYVLNFLVSGHLNIYENNEDYNQFDIIMYRNSEELTYQQDIIGVIHILIKMPSDGIDQINTEIETEFTMIEDKEDVFCDIRFYFIIIVIALGLYFLLKYLFAYLFGKKKECIVKNLNCKPINGHHHNTQDGSHDVLTEIMDDFSDVKHDATNIFVDHSCIKMPKCDITKQQHFQQPLLPVICTDVYHQTEINPVPHHHGINPIAHHHGINPVSHHHGINPVPHHHGINPVSHHHGINPVPHHHGINPVPHHHGINPVPHHHGINPLDGRVMVYHDQQPKVCNHDMQYNQSGYVNKNCCYVKPQTVIMQLLL